MENQGKGRKAAYHRNDFPFFPWILTSPAECGVMDF